MIKNLPPRPDDQSTTLQRAPRADEIGTREHWGTTTSVIRVGHLFFADELSKDALLLAKQRGIERVIDLRGPDEIAAAALNEKHEVEGLGMQYVNTPVVSGKPFDRAEFAAVSAKVGNGPTLIHCHSGNRVAAWYAAHLVGHANLKVEQAIEIANRVGLTKDKAREMLRKLLASGAK
ncbi:MAG: hypothetical protein H6707_04460 [Deltaproteobacteria bacterium]|nr:hypothetical protein [Deltaproteobacteria bacterium]